MIRHQRGGHRHTQHAQGYARELAASRGALDGMHGSDPGFDETLANAELAAGKLAGAAYRMDSGEHSHRTRWGQIVTAAVAAQAEIA